MSLFVDQPRTDLNAYSMGRVVSDAISPFKPGNAIVWLDEQDFRNNRRTLHVEVGNLPSFPFELDIDRLMLAFTPNVFISMIFQKVYEHYKNRPTLPIDDHIQLGED